MSVSSSSWCSSNTSVFISCSSTTIPRTMTQLVQSWQNGCQGSLFSSLLQFSFQGLFKSCEIMSTEKFQRKLKYLPNYNVFFTLLHKVWTAPSDDYHPSFPNDVKSRQKRSTSRPETSSYWRDLGRQELDEALLQRRNENLAKNIVLVIGDGMSLSTNTAARNCSKRMNYFYRFFILFTLSVKV